MKKILLLAVLLSGIFQSRAQQEYRYFESLKAKDKTENIDTIATIYTGIFSIGINQGMLHNWAAGGELISANINALFQGTYIEYNCRSIWTNNLDMAFGQFYAYSNGFIPRKTDDRIDLTSKYGYRISPEKDFYFTVLFNAKTQFTDAYDYEMQDWKNHPISSLLSPLYLTVAPGMEYRKGSEFSVFFSPAAMRGTFASRKFTTLNPEGAFGVENGKIFRFEIGAYLTARYKKDITPHFSYNGRFDAFSNYLAKDTQLNDTLVKKDNPANIDILWDNNFSYNFLKYFSVNFGLLAIYDNDLPYTRNEDDPTRGLGWWQVKQYLNIGFNYKF